MLANPVVCYLSEVACSELTVLSLALLLQDLVEHLLLHGLDGRVDASVGVEVGVELLPGLGLAAGLVTGLLGCTLSLFTPELSLFFDCTTNTTIRF